jgi:hypothetical protein
MTFGVNELITFVFNKISERLRFLCFCCLSKILYEFLSVLSYHSCECGHGNHIQSMLYL